MTNPMLATAGTEAFKSAVMRAVNDATIGLDVKMDGERLLIVAGAGKPQGFNRSGGATTVPRRVVAALEWFGDNELTLDGEMVGETYFIFDLIEGGGIAPSDPWRVRRKVLDDLYALWKPDPTVVQVVPWATDLEGKALLVRHVLDERLEGLIAKRIESPYAYRRKKDERSPDWTKLKHVKDADFVVTRMAINDHDNFGLGLYDGDTLVEVGEVSTLTGTGPKVKAHLVGKGYGPLDDVSHEGVVVTVTYLYVGSTGRLVQPVTPRWRTDKPAAECGIDQLGPRKAKVKKAR